MKEVIDLDGHIHLSDSMDLPMPDRFGPVPEGQFKSQAFGRNDAPFADPPDTSDPGF